MEKMMKHQELTNKNYEASMRNLERQIGQLSKQTVAERAPNALPKATKKPTENDKTSSKEQVTIEEKNQERLKEKEELQVSRKGKQIMKEPSQEQRKIVKSYNPPLPYPQRLQKEIKDQQFLKFLEVFKKLEINIPLAEALEQMPLAMIQEGIPPKLKDPGSFFLPCTIGDIIIDKALYDLGSSINLMPLSMIRRLSIDKVKPTQMSLELVDRSLVIPKGVIENLLIRVGKFIFPADFVILDLEEEGDDSIILGRPFLTIARAIIDVEQEQMTLRVNDEKITLNVFQEVQHTVEDNRLLKLNELDEFRLEAYENAKIYKEKDKR
ncbi:uncharacterized protein LOC107627281 [Arachis ipaensis]|uniref:uncharacterized protein LOC107627281 n=1 Tax=Arachis ipaensis TaxID=130454 RepID=UPI0007AFC65D|nr:uncharacterized protein LOC107627281 [Arachis ipaensis]